MTKHGIEGQKIGFSLEKSGEKFQKLVHNYPTLPQITRIYQLFGAHYFLQKIKKGENNWRKFVYIILNIAELQSI